MLGVDPGSRITGYGLVEATPDRLRYVASGCIDARPVGKPRAARGPRSANDAGEFAQRLAEIHRGMSEVVATHAPTECAIEEVFFAHNPKSALKLGQARGVAVAVAVGADLPVYEYAPRLVKQAVAGRGGATKAQVAYMVRVLLGLDAEPSPDAADALAVAICHVNMNATRVASNPRSRRKEGAAIGGIS